MILTSGKLRQAGGKFKAGPGLFSKAVSKESKAGLGERMFAQHAQGPCFKSGTTQTRVIAYNHNPVSQGEEREAQTFEAVLDYTVSSKAAELYLKRETPPHSQQHLPTREIAP